MKICKQAVLMFGLVLVLTGGAFAQADDAQDGDSDDDTTVKTLSEKCEDEWEKSDANDYCTATVTTTATLDNGTEKCTFSANCTATINLITPEFDDEGRVSGEVRTATEYTETISDVTRKLKKVKRLELCFVHPDFSDDGDQDYSMTVKVRCDGGSGEVDADIAVQDGVLDPSAEF